MTMSYPVIQDMAWLQRRTIPRRRCPVRRCTGGRTAGRSAPGGPRGSIKAAEVLAVAGPGGGGGAGLRVAPSPDKGGGEGRRESPPPEDGTPRAPMRPRVRETREQTRALRVRRADETSGLGATNTNAVRPVKGDRHDTHLKDE